MSREVDLSLGILFQDGVKAYGVAAPKRQAYCADGFVGRVDKGGSCNCFEVTLNPHCHTTHTECVSHVLDNMQPLSDFLKPFFALAQVISVDAGEINQADLKGLILAPEVSALAIRTLPNNESKKSRAYISEASYLTPDAVKYSVDCGFDHLLVDFPSIDPMFDDGKLLAHRMFWAMEEGQATLTASTQTHRSITELIYVPPKLQDGMYALNLSWVDFELDAAPSRPILYPEVAS